MDNNFLRASFPLFIFSGEGIKVVAEVQNNSSRALKLKYCLYSKHSFFARHKRRLQTNEVLKEEGDPIEPSKHQTITKILTIPPSLTMSILNCRILKVEYRLKVRTIVLEEMRE